PAGTSPAMTIFSSLLRLHRIRGQEHPYRAVDHLRDALARGWGCCLENEWEEQRGLAHQHELRGRQFAVVDRKFAQLHMRVEIFGELVVGLLKPAFVVAATDFGHPLGDRHYRADRRSAARTADHRDKGFAVLA